MQDALVTALRTKRSQIREHWEALLRVEPVSSPLGHPDSLVHMLDWTLDEIFTGLTNPLSRHRIGRTRVGHEAPPVCPCGRNPLLAYFAAGEQAMREALVLAQSGAASLDPIERDVSFEELNLILQQISRREIEAFCGVCQFRRQAAAGACVPMMAEG
ncbi:MAG: hypothetical protein JNL92_10320 [Opitutaceae bacterium]|nr:hypothetical protein [Opitutaceae bacterium]